MFCWFPSLHGSACGFSKGDLGPLFIIEYWFCPGGGLGWFIGRCHPSIWPGLKNHDKSFKSHWQQDTGGGGAEWVIVARISINTTLI